MLRAEERPTGRVLEGEAETATSVLSTNSSLRLALGTGSGKLDAHPDDGRGAAFPRPWDSKPRQHSQGTQLVQRRPTCVPGVRSAPEWWLSRPPPCRAPPPPDRPSPPA